MNCDAYLEQMSAALDDMLSLEEWQALEAHLKGCPSCQMVWQQLKENQDLLHQTPLLELPEGYHAQWKEKWQQMLAEEGNRVQSQALLKEAQTAETIHQKPEQKLETEDGTIKTSSQSDGKGQMVSFPNKKGKPYKQPWKRVGVTAAAVLLLAVIGMGGRSLLEFQAQQEEMTGSSLLAAKSEEQAAGEPETTAQLAPKTAQFDVAKEETNVGPAEEGEAEAVQEETTTTVTEEAQQSAKASPEQGAEAEAAEEAQQAPAVLGQRAVTQEEAVLQEEPQTISEESDSAMPKEAPLLQSEGVAVASQLPQSLSAEAEGEAAGETAPANDSLTTSSAQVANGMTGAQMDADGQSAQKILSRTKIKLEVAQLAPALTALSALGEQSAVKEETVVIEADLEQEETLLTQIRALGTVLEETVADEDITFWYGQTQERLQEDTAQAAALQEKASALTQSEQQSLAKLQSRMDSDTQSLSHWDEALNHTEVEVQLVLAE